MNKHLSHLLGTIKNTKTGLLATYKNEVAFQQEVWILIIILPIIYWLDTTNLEKALLLGAWLLVMIVELLNTAIETTINRISLEHHKLSGLAKDQGSAAVAIAILFAIIIWIGVLL